MIYLKSFRLPTEGMESSFVMQEKRTCFPTFYPFKFFPRKSLREIEFEGITMFYGGNGSGKSTLINVIARKLNALRYSDYNSAPFFEDYVGLCNVKYAKVPDQCVVLTSDDVFDYALNARSVNGSIDSRRRELVDNYVAVHHQYRRDAGIVRMKGLDDYDRWNDTMEILSPRRSQSAYIRNRVVPDVDLRSNGETAMHYFLERIEEEGLYFLDEPENSLSVEYQIQLHSFFRQLPGQAVVSSLLPPIHRCFSLWMGLGFITWMRILYPFASGRSYRMSADFMIFSWSIEENFERGSSDATVSTEDSWDHRHGGMSVREYSLLPWPL